MTPAFQILADGADITGKLNDRLVDLTVTLHEVGSADEVKIKLDDRDFAIDPPRKGAILTVLMGYASTMPAAADDMQGLALMGTFAVRSRKRHFDKSQGATLEIIGKSADFGKEAKRPRTEDHKDTTLGDVLRKIAGRHGWQTKISSRFDKLKVAYEAQGEESDIHLVTRLAMELDAVAPIANGKLLFLDRDELFSSIVLTKTDFIECTVSDDDRAKHSKATAHYHDQGKHERIPVTVAGDGSEGPEHMLRHTFHDADRAKAGAEGKSSQLGRMEKHLVGTLTGDNRIVAGLIVTLAFGVDLYDGEYGLKTVTHHMVKGAGYTTKIDSHKGKKGKGGKGKS